MTPITRPRAAPGVSARSCIMAQCGDGKSIAQAAVGRSSPLLPQVSPHISNRPKYFREQRLSIQHGGEGFHQWKQAAFRHGGDQVVEHASLPEQQGSLTLYIASWMERRAS